MHVKLQSWGNSQGLRIPKPIMKEIKAHVGDELDIHVEEGKIILKPLREEQKKYEIRDLVAKIQDDHKAEEEDWGSPVGKEVW